MSWTNSNALTIAQAILAAHIIAALFIIAGVVLIPIGILRSWRFIDVTWWRLLHVAALGIVVAQRLLGQRCFLSVWEEHFLALAKHGGYAVPLIHSIGDRVIHVPLPFAFGTVLYTLALFYLIVLWYWRPPGAYRVVGVMP